MKCYLVWEGIKILGERDTIRTDIEEVISDDVAVYDVSAHT